jgi:hypothetical protein
MPGLKTKEAFEDWCREFKDISFEEGRKIVNAFSKENSDKPTLPMLVRYRDIFYGRTEEKFKPCDMCNNTGVILVEKFIVWDDTGEIGDKTLYAYRCKCLLGARKYPTVQQITNDVVRGKFRDISNIWRIDEPILRYGDKSKIDRKQIVRQLRELIYD